MLCLKQHRVTHSWLDPGRLLGGDADAPHLQTCLQSYHISGNKAQGLSLATPKMHSRGSLHKVTFANNCYFALEFMTILTI